MYLVRERKEGLCPYGYEGDQSVQQMADRQGRKKSPAYDWVNDDGRNNMGNWIEAAAKKAGR